MAFDFSSASLWRTLRADPLGQLKRTWTRAGEDNLSLIGAGAAFYAFSSIAPVLAATVLTYGLVASPETVRENITALFSSLPRDAASLISGQLDTVVSGSSGKKGLGLIVALFIALYGGSKAASSMMTALNVAFCARETRGFVHTTLLALAIVAGGVLLMLVGIGSTTAIAALGDLIPWVPGIVKTVVGLTGYVVMAALAITGASALFRFGPDVDGPFRWGTPGAVLATLVWLGATAGFGLYVANFGNYGATYGALSSIIVALTWLWLSMYAFLLGAQLDERLESAAEATRDAPPPPKRRAAGTTATAAKGPGIMASVGLTLLGLVLLLRRRDS